MLVLTKMPTFRVSLQTTSSSCTLQEITLVSYIWAVLIWDTGNNVCFFEQNFVSSQHMVFCNNRRWIFETCSSLMFVFTCVCRLCGQFRLYITFHKITVFHKLLLTEEVPNTYFTSFRNFVNFFLSCGFCGNVIFFSILLVRSVACITYRIIAIATATGRTSILWGLALTDRCLCIARLMSRRWKLFVCKADDR